LIISLLGRLPAGIGTERRAYQTSVRYFGPITGIARREDSPKFKKPC
jgi:hypothetical protein